VKTGAGRKQQKDSIQLQPVLTPIVKCIRGFNLHSVDHRRVFKFRCSYRVIMERIYA